MAEGFPGTRKDLCPLSGSPSPPSYLPAPLSLQNNTKYPPACVPAQLRQLYPALCNPMDCSQPGSSGHGNSPGKNTGVSSHALLQGIFLTSESNPGLLPYRQILYHWATREAIHFSAQLSFPPELTFPGIFSSLKSSSSYFSDKKHLYPGAIWEELLM